MYIDELTLEEKAAQLIFARLGSNMPPPVRVAEDVDRISALLERVPLGGLVVFNGSYPETPRTLEMLQRQCRTPLLVTADMERGVGQQIRGATVFPHAMAFSVAGKELLARAARVQATEALASGIHVTFSPVADVNRNPKNPIIATRAFGTDPAESAALVRTFIRGCRTEGLQTTAKHFPGHGNTSRDSHEEMPVVESSREELLEYDLVPFVAAIDEGVDLIMTAHVLFPALDPDHPATLSKKILRDFLRDELGYTGTIVTDSLLMGAISRSHADPGRQAAALVDAGVDILLDIPDPQAAWEGILRAVDEGSLEPRLVEAAAERVLALKQRLAARFGRDVFTRFPDYEVGSEENRRLGQEVARRSVSLIDNRAGRLPIPSSEKILAVLIKPHRTRLDPPEEPFGEAVRATFPNATFRQIGPEATDSHLDEVRMLARKAPYIVLALVVKPAAWQAFGLLPEQRGLVEDLLGTREPIIVSLGSPFILDEFENAGARLCTFSDVESSQRAVVNALAGR
jgi:beta-glucosidase-like glycosyl hydrolase